MDDLARQRARRAQRATTHHLAGLRRHAPPEPEPAPGDIRVILADLEQIEGMTEEVLAEVRVLGEVELESMVDAMRLTVHASLRVARAIGGGE